MNTVCCSRRRARHTQVIIFGPIMTADNSVQFACIGWRPSLVPLNIDGVELVCNSNGEPLGLPVSMASFRRVHPNQGDTPAVLVANKT